MQKKLLIISYYAQMPGACQAEWIDDKIDSLVEYGYKIILISSSCCQKHSSTSVKHIRIPSISYLDYKDELIRTASRGESVSLFTKIFSPVSASFGRCIDIAHRLLTQGVGEGRWSWSISASIPAVFTSLFFRPSIILSTGGPASAHLAAIVASKLTRTRLVVELQDPLSGTDIGRNKQSQGWLLKVERLIVSSADKVAYVTQGALAFAANQFGASNLCCVYPGSKNFLLPDIEKLSKSDNIFRLIHLGSLYSTRSFDTVIEAIDFLIAAKLLRSSEIQLINLGHVEKAIYKRILDKSYVKVYSPLSRQDALSYAKQCDLSLLIQNSDDRSQVTIPYKTYDYLNIGNPVLGLLNSEELTYILRKHGHHATSFGNIEEISSSIIEIMNNSPDSISPSIFDPLTQALLLIEL